MRSLFAQLFLSFWIATIGIFLGASLFSPNQDPGTPENLRAAISEEAAKTTQLLLASYREHGCTVAETTPDEFFLFNASGQPLCAEATSALRRNLLQEAAKTGTAASRRDGAQWILVSPVTLATGERFYLMQALTSRRRPWIPPLPRSALPVSLAVTLLFAYLLTRPIRALSTAFRRFTSGDIGTRLPVSDWASWFGAGSPGVRTLMRDFNSMADRVTELIEAQKLLIRDISHELRSPLARLRMALELAREDADVPLLALDRMEREADRVNELIGEMLTLSLLESTRQPPRSEEIDLEELIEGLLPDLQFEAAARDCSIHFTPMDSENFQLRGQPEMLRRALENIVRNSIRYTPPGESIEVEISKKTVEGPKTESKGFVDHVTVCIQDRGPGISEANLPHIFRPFYRVDMSRDGRTGGFGVGLAIAERAVQIHGGSIHAANRDGGGLSVEIILPIAGRGEASHAR